MQKYDATKDYYDVLGVASDATPDEIDRAYRLQARRVHPDSGGSEDEMKALNEAHDLLSDPETRTAYDKERRPPQIAYGSSYAFDVDASAKVGAFEAQPDAEGVSGALISAATCLGLGVPFLILVESQWFFFLWPLRVMAIGMIGFGLWMANSGLSAYHRTIKKKNGKPARAGVIVQKSLFWMIAGVFLAILIVGLYVR